MDFIPSNVFKIIKYFKKFEQRVHPTLIKVYMYQLFRALNYMQLKEIIHRDIKPQNLLIDPSCHILKVCDFGSAKKLEQGEKSSSYICSRYYRAPELMFGARNYSYPIDMWSAGCVMGELITGEPLFRGEMAHSQLIEVIKKLGSPSEEQILKMNPDYKRKGFPSIEP
jgi:glycogen synthase kinase 3 beta